MSLTDVFGDPLLSNGTLARVFARTGTQRVVVYTSVVGPQLGRALSSVYRTLDCISCLFPGCTRTGLLAKGRALSRVTSYFLTYNMGAIIVGANGSNYFVGHNSVAVGIPTITKVATVSAVNTNSGFTSNFVTTLLRNGGLHRYTHFTGTATTVSILDINTAANMGGEGLIRRLLRRCRKW